MKIRDLMTADVKTCHPEDTLNAAAQLMWENDIGCAPVVDEGGTLCGMLTDRDICMAVYTRGGELGAHRVQDAMSRDVITCSPAADVAKAEQQMRTKQIRRIPVVRAGRVVGLVALNDIALAASRDAKKSNGLTLEEVGQTMAAICRHRSDDAMAGSTAA